MFELYPIAFLLIYNCYNDYRCVHLGSPSPHLLLMLLK